MIKRVFPSPTISIHPGRLIKSVPLFPCVCFTKPEDAAMAALKKKKSESSHEHDRSTVEECVSLRNQFFNISLAANSIADTNGILVQANAAFIRMWGYLSLDDVLGKHIRDFFEHTDDADAIIEALNSIGTWEGNFIAKKENGAAFHAHGLATTLVDDGGTLIGYQSTVLDISATVQIEHQLNEAQRIAHIGSWELDLTTNTLRWSDEIYRIFEIDPEKFGASYESFLDTVHPDDRDAVNEAYRNSVDNRIPYSIEHRLLFPDGRIKHVHEQCETFYSHQGVPLRSVGTVQDITEQKIAEKILQRSIRALRTISACNQVLVRATTESELMKEICSAVLTEGNYRFAWLGMVEHDEGKKIRPVAYAGFEEGYLKQTHITWSDTEHGRGPTGTAVRSGRAALCSNMLVDPNFAPWREEALKRGYASSIALPLKTGDTVIGVLSIYAAEPDAFGPEEEKLFSELADDLTFGIMSVRMRADNVKAERTITVLSRLGQQLNSATTQKEAARIIADAADTLFGWNAFTLDSYSHDKDCVLSVLNIDTIDNKRVEVVTYNECTKPSHRIRRIIEKGPELHLRTADAVFDIESIPFGDVTRPSISLMYVPIRNGDTVVGVLSIQSYSVNAYQRSDLDLFQSLADYCSGALERIRISQEIIKSEERYRTLYENNPMMVFTIDAEGTVLSVNESGAEQLGYTVAELVGASVLTVFHEDDKTKALQHVHEILKEPTKIFTWELRKRHKNGTIMWVSEVGSVLSDTGGNVTILIDCEDITARKNIEEQNRAIINAVPDLLFRIDKDGIILDYKTPNDSLLYAPPEAFLGKSVHDVLPSEVARQASAAIETSLRNNSATMFEYSLSIEGEDRFYEARVVPLSGNEILAVVRDVTERKLAEREVTASKELLERMFSSIHVLVAYMDRSFNFIRVNEAYAAADGHEPAFYIGKNHFALFPNKENEQIFRRVVETGDPYIAAAKPFEYVGHPERGIGYWDWRLEPVRDNTGAIQGLILSLLDVTERKQAEQERLAHLRFFESMDQVNRAIQRTDDFAQMMGSALDVVMSIFLCDRASLVYPCDPEAPSWKVPMERTRPEYPGAMAQGIDIPSDAESREVFTAVLDADGPVSFGAGALLLLPAIVRGYGTQSQLAMALYPKTGSPWVFVLHQCSYPREWTEGERRLFKEIGRRLTDALSGMLSHRNLQESEERYRRLFEENLAGTFVSKPDGTLVDCNDAFLQIFRIASREEAKRTNVATFYTDAALRQQLLLTLQNEKKIQYFEFTAIRKDGTPAYIVENAVGKFDDKGNLVEIQGFLFDDTKRRQLERDLLQVQKLEGLGTIAGGVAHDFNNILGIIMAHSTMLDRWRNDPDRFNQGVAAVVKATHRGAALVKQLLTIARKTEINFQPLQINDVIKEVSKLLQETFPKLITIASSLQDDLPFVFADSTQLHQVVLNLCVNARDAMPNGGTLTISTSIAAGASLNNISRQTKSSDYICIEVTDTGFGMDDSTQRRIFEPFFTTKEPGKGTGLGLSLVFSIVENHRGFIDVHSAVGIGTSFKIYLPVPEHTTDERKGEKKSETEIRGGTETILVIEDEEMLRSLLEVFLKNKGYTVLTADDGIRGVALFQSHADSISLVLSDLGLPGLSGDAVLGRIKKINPRVKMILASGYIDPEKKSVLYQSGIRHFIQKPYSDKDVLQKIRVVLDSEQ